MKTNILFGTTALLAGSLLAADPSPKDDVTNAAKKLADQSSYSWKTTVTVPEGGGGRFRPGPSEGKIEKDGFTWFSMTMRDNTTEFVMKGDKAAVKTPDGGWQSKAEATEGSEAPGPAMFLARRLESFKTPAAEAEDLAGKAKELKKDGDVISGDLTEDAAKALLTFGPRRGGGEGPTISGAKGSVKFWVKDGVLSKYELNVQGKITFNENERDLNRTTTVEIKDVGTTKVEVPEEAKKKLS
jgi:hypothetical protein